MLILSLKTANNQRFDRLRKELHEAFLCWIQIRRNTKRILEELARNLPNIPLRQTSSFVKAASAVASAASVLGTLAAPFSFGTSLVVSALGDTLIAAIKNSAGLADVQVAIDEDRRACAHLPRQLHSLTRIVTFSYVIQVVPFAFDHVSRFADSSVLPRDITQFVTSSFDRHHGSTSLVVCEIRGILANLKCPDETEIQLLVETFIAGVKFAEV